MRKIRLAVFLRIFFFFQAEDGIRDLTVTGVQTCALPIYGAKSAFGDTSVSAGGPNPDDVAVFAAQRSSDGALTVMIVAKVLSGATPATQIGRASCRERV